jgi:hypothetical protein
MKILPTSTWRRKSSEPEKNAQEVQYERFLQVLNELADRLSVKQILSPEATNDHIVQVIAVVAILIHQHQVDKRGQCRLCVRPGWWKFWSRRPLCRVYRTTSFIMSQGLDTAWWQLFDRAGKSWNLGEVREWMKSRQLDRICVVCGGLSGESCTPSEPSRVA